MPDDDETGIDDFVAARLTEDEVTAKQAADHHPGAWVASRGPGIYLHDDGPHLETGDGDDWVKRVNTGVWLCDDPGDDCESMRGKWMAQAEHAARWDPARVLAEVALWRSLIEDYRVVSANNVIEKATGGDQVGSAAREVIVKSLRMMLRRRANTWSDHPQFKPEWRIDG